MANGKGKGGRGSSAPRREKTTERGGGKWTPSPAQATWSCGCLGMNASKNWGWRESCVACNKPRPKKLTRHTTEVVSSPPKDRPWSGEARLRQSEKEVRDLRDELAAIKKGKGRAAHDIPVEDDDHKDVGMDDVELPGSANQEVQKLRAKKKELQRTLAAIKKMPTSVCASFVSTQSRDVQAKVDELDKEIEKALPAHQKVAAAHRTLEASKKTLEKAIKIRDQARDEYEEARETLKAADKELDEAKEAHKVQADALAALETPPGVIIQDKVPGRIKGAERKRGRWITEKKEAVGRQGHIRIWLAI